MRLFHGSILALCLLGITMAKPASYGDSPLRAVSLGTNQFSSSLFQAITEQKRDNLICSPLSAAVVLAMAAYGSRGETERQFRNVLHIPSDDAVSKKGYQNLIDDLNNVTNVELRVANKVFTTDAVPIKTDYADLTQTYFRSTSQAVDFSKSKEAADVINTWTKEQTKDRIKDLVSPGDLDASTTLVLVNAVYFKGQWGDKFSPEDTKDLPFHVDANTVKNVSTMFRHGTYKYGVLPDMKAQFIELPYAGGDLSMLIFLPDEINGLPEVEQKLRGKNLAEILYNSDEGDVDLYLPKFKIESELKLKVPLVKLGLSNMFTDYADFSGIADGNLSVSKVIQKAFIEVNEKGSEAAAATGLIIVLESYTEPAEINVNRPFYYCIIKREDPQLLLFSGHIVDPSL